MFAHFSFEDFFLRHGAQVPSEANFFEEPDCPFGGVELPRLHAVAIVVLKLVVEVVVALAKGKNRHEQAVAGRDIAGIWALADPVAEGVDAECHMMHEHDPRHAGDEEGAERCDRSAIDPTDGRWQNKTHKHRDRHIIFMLEPGEFVFLQIPHPSEWRFWPATE